MYKRLNPNGTKAIQKRYGDIRMRPYREFHSGLGRGYYMQDLDSVEYRYEDGKLRIAALIEITRADNGKTVDEHYLDGILERFRLRDSQGSVVVEMADRLGVPAFVVLFKEDVSCFWVFCLADPLSQWVGNEGWVEMEPDQYAHFLEVL